MASGFVVTAAALKKLSQELRQLNSQYKSKVESLAGLEQELRAMWEGEANLSFQRSFANDKVNLDNFYTVIENYATALDNAAAEYEKAESAAASIASSRNY